MRDSRLGRERPGSGSHWSPEAHGGTGILPGAPGLSELEFMCRQARLVTEICDLVGIGAPEHRARDLHELENDDHYIWDD